MTRLTSRSFLHLMPEEVGGQFLSPFFAHVVSTERDTVRFRGLEGGEGTVPRSVASSRTISAAVVKKVGHVSPCRQPVMVTTSTQFLHSQVTRVNVDGVTVESDGTEVEAAFDNVKEVAPVVALLLQKVVFEKSVWSSGEVSELHVTILNRVLGREGCIATRDVSDILDGLIEEECFPEGQSDCAWIDPKSGQNTQFELQHAVDFAYYIDGKGDRGHEMVGRSFCVPPYDDGIDTGENQGSEAHEGPLITDDEC
ncbi:hypothetical protein PF004_g5500 [Phytophthora fragariae]|uniref:Uncharacterized protein n=2 Tax=Phytophthora fragariae TaxID=53985 RepID=A0A6A3LPU0_9STRA|nr:hypothetical protein PF011_g5520 [Phytophthora fragariae]KAE9244850.1 hypothetical protein PF004_g5500 [Phytophthora fragariae]